MLKQKQVRVPTLLALFLLIAVIAGGFFLSDGSFNLSGKAASPDIVPQDVRISNISDSSFVVSWITVKKTPGIVKTENETFSDIRDLESVPKEYKTHYVELKNFQPEQEVSFEIFSGGKSFPQEKVNLAKKLEPGLVLPINGKISSPNGLTTTGAIFYVEMDNAALWSYFTYNQENWVIPLAYVRTADLLKNYCEENCSNETKVDIQIYGEEGNSQIISSLKDLRPMPEKLVLGNGFDYLNASPVPTMNLIAVTPSVQGAKTEKADLKVDILTPEEDSHLTFPKPFIRGLGIPGEKVSITIQSQEKQTGQVTVRDDGTWYWNPKNSLEPGKHTLTITTVDENGKTVKLTRTFNILKSGESVLAGATQSADITPSPTKIATPTLVIPTSTPGPTIYIPTPTPTLPSSGFFASSAIMVGSGAFLLLLGLTIL